MQCLCVGAGCTEIPKVFSSSFFCLNQVSPLDWEGAWLKHVWFLYDIKLSHAVIGQLLSVFFSLCRHLLLFMIDYYILFHAQTVLFIIIIIPITSINGIQQLCFYCRPSFSFFTLFFQTHLQHSVCYYVYLLCFLISMCVNICCMTCL